MVKRLLLKSYLLQNEEYLLKLKEKNQLYLKKIGSNLFYYNAILCSWILALLILSFLKAEFYIWLSSIIEIEGYGYILHLILALNFFFFNHSLQQNKLAPEEYLFLAELAHLKHVFIKNIALFVLLGCYFIILNSSINPGLYWSFIIGCGWSFGFVVHPVYYFNRSQIIKRYLIKKIGCEVISPLKRKNKKQKTNFSRYYEEFLSLKKLLANNRFKLSLSQENISTLNNFFDFLLFLLRKIINTESLLKRLKPHAYGLAFGKELRLLKAKLKRPRKIYLGVKSSSLIQRLILELIEELPNLGWPLETVLARSKKPNARLIDKNNSAPRKRESQFIRWLKRIQIKMESESDQFFKIQAELEKLQTC